MTLSPDAQLVATFLSRVLTDIYAGSGVRVGLADLRVLSAGKKLSAPDGISVIRHVVAEFDKTNPEAVDMIVAGLGEGLKDKLRSTLK